MDASFSRLAWKDIQLVRTLVYVAAFASVICNLSIVIAYRANPWATTDGGTVLWLPWWAIHFLSAIGLPALLVGSEQENGTLAWLRTLPIPRARIIRAKLWVALAALVISWAISTAALLIAIWALPSMYVTVWSSNTSPEVICGVVYYSVNFLLCGFIAGYFMRSPYAAIFVSMLLAFFALPWIGFQREFVPQSETRLWGVPVTTVLAGTGYLVLLVWLQHVLALSRLRLGNPSKQSDPERYSLLDALGVSLDHDSSASATHLNVRLSLPKWKRQGDHANDCFTPWVKPAKPMKALFWQAYSQQFWPVLGLTLVALVFWVLNLLEPVALLMCWLGSLTFYGDTVGKRHLYFAERPIDRSGIWLTRMLLPLSAIALLTVLVWISSFVGIEPWSKIAPGYFGFGIGALVSMAASRPILGFLGGPALFLIAMLFQAIYLSDYWPYVSWSGIAAVPVLFGTWRLIPRWKRGLRGIGFDARVVAYVLLGMLSLAVAVFGYRIASIPAEQTAWRREMMNDTQAVSTVNSSDTKFDLEAYLSQRQTILSSWTSIHPSEMASSRRRLLTLSSEARQAILDGELDSGYLFSQIEKDEENVLLELLGMPSMQLHETLRYFSSSTLRKASREFALKQQWRRYQEQTWHDEWLPGSPYSPKNFAGFTVGRELVAYPWERKRADRLVDLAVKETLEAIERGSWKDERTAQRIEHLWRQIRNFELQSSRAIPFASPISLFTDILLANQIANSNPTNGSKE